MFALKKKEEQAPLFLTLASDYLQEPGNHFALLPAQTQPLILLLASVDGVKVTTRSFAALIAPDTVITPVVSPTDKFFAYLVAVKPPPQVLDRLLKPTVCTCSLTQVRAPLAARITSEALARLV